MQVPTRIGGGAAIGGASIERFGIIKQLARTSAVGQKRKSSVGLGMSAVGGKAEVDFKLLDVSL